MNPDVKFFFENAGFGYDPKKETEKQGKYRSARAMAAAESWARNAGVVFRWDHCDTTSREFSDKRPFYQLWACMAEFNGERASCGGIDFGNGGEPWGQPYKRVMEAQLAQELKP